MEAGELGLYMFLVCMFTTLLQHPTSPVRHLVPTAIVRRAIMGLLVGSTVVAIILTPWGKQSGGHFNPAIALTFYRLGKVEFWDTLFYVTAQFTGAAGGVAIAAYLLRGSIADAAVRYAVTAPGIFGNAGALAGEVSISFILMTAILFASNHEALARYTAYVVGVLYATFITFETPLSGISMNPARTFGSAFRAGYWQAIWVYFHCAYSGYARRRRDLFVGSRRNSALLREAKSRQRQALYISAPRSAARVQDSHF